MKSKLFRRLLTAGWILLSSLLGLELAVRVWGYAEPNLSDPVYMASDHPAEIAYVHKPNLVQARGRGRTVFNTDRLGLRSKTAGASYGPKQPGEYRIALVGDSVTFGEGVARTEDTFAQLLEDALNQRQKAKKVRVFNFGVSAYSVKEMAATLKYRVPGIEPDVAVMVLIPSDFNLRRTPTVDEAGYLIGIRFSQAGPPLAQVRDILRHLHLGYVLKDIPARLTSRAGTLQRLSADAVPETYRYVLDFKRESDLRGIRSLVVLVPRLLDNAWGALPQQLQQDHVEYLDLTPIAKEFPPEQFNASQFDGHPSVAVHRRIGAELASYFLARSLNGRTQ